MRKRTVVVPVARLPLKDEHAIHTFKLLAGVRWSPEPPKDAGIGPDETGREHGYLKISCEDFPKGPMNLKWISDTLDRLIAESNVSHPHFAPSLRVADDLYRTRRSVSPIFLWTHDIWMPKCGRQRKVVMLMVAAIVDPP